MLHISPRHCLDRQSPTDSADEPKNIAENNHIYNTGRINKGGASGVLCKGVGNVVSHNYLHSMPRVGVWFDGNEHVIEYNHVCDVNRETQDSGAIYSSQIDWTKRGTILRFNYVHGGGGYGWDDAEKIWRTPYGTYGIYLDDWTSGTYVYGNIVKETTMGGIFIHGGRDNRIENNIIIDGGRLGQMVYSGWPVDRDAAKYWLPKMYERVLNFPYDIYPSLKDIKDVSSGAKMAGNSFLRNVVYYTAPGQVLFGVYNNIDLESTNSNYNTIFTTQDLSVPYFDVPTMDQWSAWLAKGLDQGSLVADPLFNNLEAEEFQLEIDSPAIKMGFKGIPFDDIGVYEDGRRASWPVPIH